MCEIKKNIRVKWIDIIKGICIIFVMLDHSYPPDDYVTFFTPFFLTMFFFASGYTFSLKKSFMEFFIKKVYHLLVPLFSLGCIRVLGMSVLGMTDLRVGLLGLLLQINCMHDELWFISCMFTASLILYGIIKLSQIVCRLSNHSYSADICILVSSVFLGLIGYWDILFLHIRFVYELELACIMTFYYALGYLYKRYEFSLSKSISKIFCLVSFLVYLLLISVVDYKVDIHMEVFGSPALFAFSSFIIILPFVQIAQLIESTRSSRFFEFMGQNTLFYFAFSGFIRVILDKIVYFSIDPHIYSILCTMCMVVALIIPAKLIKKWTPWLAHRQQATNRLLLLYPYI